MTCNSSVDYTMKRGDTWERSFTYLKTIEDENLTIGVTYTIESNAGSADFTNVGASDNNVGTEFTATGTTPTEWGDGQLSYPQDISGWTVFFTMKREVDNDLDDSSAIIKKDITSHSDPTNGETTITLSSTDTNVVTPGETYVYDVQWFDGSTFVKTFPSGTIFINGDVTRRTS